MSRNTLQVPDQLMEKLEEHLSQTEFNDTDEFAQFIIRNVICVLETESEFEDSEGVDHNEVQERLESLGYLET